MQSLFAAQVVLQAPFDPQPHGSHSVEVTAWQLPTPSQVRAGVSRSPTQVPATQTVAAG